MWQQADVSGQCGQQGQMCMGKAKAAVNFNAVFELVSGIAKARFALAQLGQSARGLMLMCPCVEIVGALSSNLGYFGFG